LSAVGQAAGTAAAMAVDKGVTPRGMNGHIKELQQRLLLDDCYLPWVKQVMPEPTRQAGLTASVSDPEPLRDGVSWQVGNDPHCWECGAGDWAAYTFRERRNVQEVRLALDSAMEKQLVQSQHLWKNSLTRTPDAMPRDLALEGLRGGRWETLVTVRDNYQRHLVIPLQAELDGVRLLLQRTWGAHARSRVYAFYVRGT
ncbi:MAG: hypothetical protein Q8O57_07100, partial [Kiritimatiellota bacterium]|nr:hypothetical protein [Kiritimatiellota bacterium]